MPDAFKKVKSLHYRHCLGVVLVSLGSLFGQVPRPAHVLIVVEENHDYEQIIGSAAAPFINELAASNNAALFIHSFALTHPSQPNMLMLYSGSNQSVTDDALPPDLPFTSMNIGASLIKSGLSFVGYSEDLPSIGFEGTSSGLYVRKHNPWVNWQNSPVNGIPEAANLPLSNFPVAFDSLPTVSFVIPNLECDMHNGTDPETITAGDEWLQHHVNNYLEWARTNNSLFILTFDEGSNAGCNHIVTLFVGPMVKHGEYADSINHYSLLRTLEEMFALPHEGETGTASPILNCWISSAGLAHGPNTPPLTAALGQNYPNPFNPSTRIGFVLPRDSRVRLDVYNLLGQHLIELANEEMKAGYRELVWNAALASGTYFYRLESTTLERPRQFFSDVKKMTILR